jgi:UDP-N-acetylmuramoylalanine--D-glutamate ligase
MPAQLRGRTVLVAGLGVSGVAAARALVAAGAHVRAVESASDEEVRTRAATLAELGVDTEVGVALDDVGTLAGVELLVPSPGIPERSPLLTAALHARIPVWSEPELAWRLSEGRTRLVVVTGTNGKTTTTELVGALLDAPTGGNIGTALTELLTVRQPPLAVAELSSFQLRFTQTLRAEVAVLLNVAPDHLDWHGDLERYTAAKARAWANSGSGDAVVLGDDDGARQAIARHPTEARVIEVQHGPPGQGQVGVADGWIVASLDEGPRRVARVDDLALRGPHNVANACAAVAAAMACGADPETLADRLVRCAPGPHRLALVAERDRVRWVDDSKATNPHAAVAALEACGADGPVVWIAGGLAKGLRFDTLETSVRAHVRHAITIGASGPDLANLTRAWDVPTTEAGDLRRAGDGTPRSPGPGATVLLAPACASMDQFRDYAERGRVFASLVEAASRGTADGPPAANGSEGAAP